MPDPIAPLIEALHASGRLRVWSIVITIFGDAVDHRGGRIAMQDLQKITTRIGISDSALRTAMSRLAKEGWVERERDGRNSIYSMSKARRKEARLAAQTIYRSTLKSPASDLMFGIGEGPLMPGALWLTKTVQMWDKTEARAKNDDLLILKARPETMPQWALDEVIPQQLDPQIDQLVSILAQIKSSDTTDLTPHDALVLRILIAHFWRRIALRLPNFAANLMPETWRGFECHDRVAQIYGALWARSEQAFEWGSPAKSPKITRF